jgi:hypothetical protein
VDGRRVELYAPTKEAARERLFEAMRSRADNVPIILKSDSVEKFMAQWLEAKQPSWKPSAYRFNEKYVRVHIVPGTGSHPTREAVGGTASGAVREEADDALADDRAPHPPRRACRLGMRGALAGVVT